MHEMSLVRSLLRQVDRLCTENDGHSVSEIRVQLGIRPEQLADELGCDVATIYRYERGQRPVPRSKQKALTNLVELTALTNLVKFVYDSGDEGAA